MNTYVPSTAWVCHKKWVYCMEARVLIVGLLFIEQRIYEHIYAISTYIISIIAFQEVFQLL